MAFFDFLDMFTGKETPKQQTITPVPKSLNEAYGAFQGSLPAYLSGQQALATGQANIGMGVANQLDPNILANYTGANKYYADQLNLGSSMSPELQAEITRNLLSTNAGSGFGASPGGIGNVLYQTAVQKQALADQRARNSLAAGSGGIGIAQSLYQPTAPIGAGSILQMQDETRAAIDNLVNYNTNLEAQNKSKEFGTLMRIGGSIIGGVVGAYTGNPVGGVQAGGAIGQSFVPGGGVAGFNNQQAQQSSNPFSSLLSLFGGGGGGRFISGTGGRPDAVTAGSVPFGGAFI